ncbi:MAG: hypothetical protein AAF514_19695 [Verrucomicrobiota bacterium]
MMTVALRMVKLVIYLVVMIVGAITYLTIGRSEFMSNGIECAS